MYIGCVAEGLFGGHGFFKWVV